MKKILLILFCFPIIGISQSVPQGINYQAVASDASGDILMNQPLLVKFSIISDITNSAISWQETHQVTTNTYGLFTSIIGQGTSTTIGSSVTFDMIDWGGSNHLLKVEIDYGSGYIDMGTTAFMSVPYSMNASNVDPTDELQYLFVSGDTLFISNGNFILIPGLSLINTLIVQGCTDSTAFNYDPNVNTDDGSCISVVLGCIDFLALNYNSNANTDDGSCISLCSEIHIDTVEACDNYVWFDANGDTILTQTNQNIGLSGTVPGNYGLDGVFHDTIVYTNVGGCDSIRILHLTVNSSIVSSSQAIDIFACDSWTSPYTGQVITTSGSQAVTTGVSPQGCDSLQWYNIYLTAEKRDDIIVTACDTFTWIIANDLGGVDTMVYTSPTVDSMVYTGIENVYLNNSGDTVGTTICDSIVYLHLIIDNSCAYGCTDSTAFNYDPLALYDDGNCIAVVLGCTDSNFANYNPLANIEDGSCSVPLDIYGCTDSSAINYNPIANIEDSSCYYCSITTNIISFFPSSLSTCDGFINITPITGITPYTYIWNNGNNSNINLNLCDGVYTYTILDANGCGFTETIVLTTYGGCTDSLACNYDSTALINDGTCLTIYGCTDSLACNYNSSATCDNGTCLLYAGCMDSTSYNYDPTAICDDGSCLPFVYGCMDSTAIFYDSTANTDDGSCIYCDISINQVAINNNTTGQCDGWALIHVTSSHPPLTYSWGNGFTGSFNQFLCAGVYLVSVIDYVGCTIDTNVHIGNVVYGCMDSNVSNYNPLANTDDGSCCVDGCTDSLALNYNSLATCDDNSCVYGLGDFYQGGVIFYLDGNGGGLIAAPVVGMSKWGCYGVFTGANGHAIGTGAQNTINIVNACSEQNTAAFMCDTLTLGGYTDWFLPSNLELEQLYLNKSLLGMSGVYWSSTEISNNAYFSNCINFDDITFVLNMLSKNKVRNVCAIRQF